MRNDDKALQEFLAVKAQLEEDERAYQQARGSYQHAQQLVREKFGTSNLDKLVRKANEMNKAIAKRQGIFARNLARFTNKYKRHLQTEE